MNYLAERPAVTDLVVASNKYVVSKFDAKEQCSMVSAGNGKNLGALIQEQLQVRNGRDLLEFIATLADRGVPIAESLVPFLIEGARRCIDDSPSVSLQLLEIAYGASPNVQLEILAAPASGKVVTGLEAEINELERRIHRGDLCSLDPASSHKMDALSRGIADLRKRIRERNRHQEICDKCNGTGMVDIDAGTMEIGNDQRKENHCSDEELALLFSLRNGGHIA
jgi:hypothetical protein